MYWGTESHAVLIAYSEIQI